MGRDRRWAYALLGICVVALGIRVGYVLGCRDMSSVEGDAAYYHEGANLLADGHGFIHPFIWDDYGKVSPGADHPPGYILVLAVPSLLGLDSIRAHVLTSCLVGTGTVALIGLFGRRLGGNRVGLLAAAIAAVYPNLWFNDGALMSETLALFSIVAVSLLAYRVWDNPTRRRWIALGASLGLAALVRAESVLMLGLLVVPLAIWAPGLGDWRRRARLAGAALAVALLVMAPWVGANLVRFEHPEALSSQNGMTLLVANCDDTYHGPNLGYWSAGCIPYVGDSDRSVVDQWSRTNALGYAHHHAGRLPVVVAARLGRTWGLYAPRQQIFLDRFSEGRNIPPGQAAMAGYYVLVAFSVAGIVALRRRGTPVFPLTVWLANVTIITVVVSGATRFRAPAEPALILLAAAGLVAVVEAWPSPPAQDSQTAGP